MARCCHSVSGLTSIVTGVWLTEQGIPIPKAWSGIDRLFDDGNVG